MSKRIRRNFYLRPTLVVARQLLGKYLVRKIGREIKKAKIVEVEAYIGPKDKASHAYGGRITQRNKAIYLAGGHAYVYLCYGIHWMLNLVTQDKGIPECVLVRAVQPVIPCKIIPYNLVNGPAKLCRWLKIDGTLNEEDLVNSNRLWLEKGEDITKDQIVASERIGVEYAQEWAKKPWRFYLRDNLFVSRK